MKNFQDIITPDGTSTFAVGRQVQWKGSSLTSAFPILEKDGFKWLPRLRKIVLRVDAAIANTSGGALTYAKEQVAKAIWQFRVNTPSCPNLVNFTREAGRKLQEDQRYRTKQPDPTYVATASVADAATGTLVTRYEWSFVDEGSVDPEQGCPLLGEFVSGSTIQMNYPPAGSLGSGSEFTAATDVSLLLDVDYVQGTRVASRRTGFDMQPSNVKGNLSGISGIAPEFIALVPWATSAATYAGLSSANIGRLTTLVVNESVNKNTLANDLIREYNAGLNADAALPLTSALALVPVVWPGNRPRKLSELTIQAGDPAWDQQGTTTSPATTYDLMIIGYQQLGLVRASTIQNAMTAGDARYAPPVGSRGRLVMAGGPRSRVNASTEMLLAVKFSDVPAKK